MFCCLFIICTALIHLAPRLMIYREWKDVSDCSIVFLSSCWWWWGLSVECAVSRWWRCCAVTKLASEVWQLSYDTQRRQYRLLAGDYACQILPCILNSYLDKPKVESQNYLLWLLNTFIHLKLSGKITPMGYFLTKPADREVFADISPNLYIITLYKEKALVGT